MGARWRLSHPSVELRLAPLLLLALAIQLIAIYAPLGSDDLPRRILMVAGYVGLLGFVGINLKRSALVVLGLGALLNFLPIVANGGLMPITPETLLKTGDIPEDARVGEWVEGTKDVLKEREDVHLYFLSDRLTSDLSPFRAFSIGDLIILAGAVILAADLLLPRPQRVNR
ncbi:MAG TPA: DUF5317 family protein [Dehalococcoidia bacterium]|nr:DUF5317 family protein [Dehalococcoidia bacterium]